MHSATSPSATLEEKPQGLVYGSASTPSSALLVTPKDLYSAVGRSGLFTPRASSVRRGSLPLKKRRVLLSSSGEEEPYDASFRTDNRMLHHFNYCSNVRIPSPEECKLQSTPSPRHWKRSEPYLPYHLQHSYVDVHSKKRLMVPPEANFASYASSFDRVQSRSYEPPREALRAGWKDSFLTSPPPPPESKAPLPPSDALPPHLVTPQPMKPAIGGPDKRYTGADQVRCPATTTRGRPCAYQAVTKYCHLHADYDTHPPPRRKSKDEPEEERKDSPVVSVASEASGKRRNRMNAKWAVKHAESPFPLLSMLATEQWQGQKVRVAVGPFSGHVGTVQKWGNGWITIFIPDVGYHNRRSFELYLVDEEEDDDDDNDKKTLFRCVSRDGVSPSPSSTKHRETPTTLEMNLPVFAPSVGERTRSTGLGSPH